MKRIITLFAVMVCVTIHSFAQEAEEPAAPETGEAVAQEAVGIKPKHKAGDMSITIGYGMNFLGTGNISKITGAIESIKNTNINNYQETANTFKDMVRAHDNTSTSLELGLGVGFEYYIINWLNVGGMLYFNGGVLAGQSESDSNKLGVGAPLWLSVPISFNVNVPAKGLEWIYAGVGIQFDFLLADFLKGTFDMDDINDKLEEAHRRIQTPKYKLTGLASGQIMLFQDIGFDFIHYNKNSKRRGGRLVLRLYENLGPFSEGAWEKGLGLGFFWNFGNFKLNK